MSSCQDGQDNDETDYDAGHVPIELSRLCHFQSTGRILDQLGQATVEPIKAKALRGRHL